MMHFRDYYQSQWLNNSRFPRDVWSVHQTHSFRTNCAVEARNLHLQKCLGSSGNITLWKWIKALKFENQRQQIKMEQQFQGQTVGRP
jgi:hypothetical protein